ALVLAPMYAVLGWLVLQRLRLGIRGAEAFAWSVALGTGVGSLYLFALVASGLLRSSADGHGLARLLWLAAPIAALGLIGARAAVASVSRPFRSDPWG